MGGVVIRSNIILMMSLSGSVVCIIYIVLCRFMKRTLTVRLRYNLLKVTILFFLFPFPEFKYRLPGILGELMVSRPTINSKGYPVLANVIQLGSDLENTLIPLVTKIGFVVLGLAIIAAMITLTFQLVGYFQIERACKKNGI